MPKPISPVYGWKKGKFDNRDYKFSVARPSTGTPSEMDLRGPNMPPIWDQGNLGSCFPAGTYVRMADGGQRKIEDIRLLDEVVTAEGNTGRVKKTMVRMESEGLFHIKLWGHNLLKLTGEHPILTKNGYVKASEIKIDDWVSLSKYISNTTEEIETGDYISHKEILTKSLVVKKTMHCRPDTAITYSTVPAKIKLTTGFGKIIGFFLAEGSCDPGKIRFTFCIDEEHTLVKECIDRLKEELGVDAYLQRRPNNSINVVVYGTAWSRLFEKLCGNGSGNKRVNSKLTSGPLGFQKMILEGWLQGDGHNQTKNGKIFRTSGITISHELALNMYDIAQAVGHTPSINFSRPVMNAAAKTRRNRWVVELGSGSDTYRMNKDENCNWRKVREISKDDFVGDVYNISVEGDESYVAEGIGVHNCTAHGIGRIYQFAVRKAGLPDLKPSRLFLYYNERRDENTISFDAGAIVRDGIKTLNKYGYGIVDESLWPYDISKFTWTPPQEAYDAAKANTIRYYASLDGLPLESLKLSLVHGYPFVFGFSVYQNFEDYEDGQILQLPEHGRELGGHCVAAVAYSDAKKAFLCANSWSEDWGTDHGFFWMSYDYMMSELVSDRWMMRLK